MLGTSYDAKRASEYRERANLILARAQRVTDPVQLDLMRSIAAMFHRLAQQLEGDIG